MRTLFLWLFLLIILFPLPVQAQSFFQYPEYVDPFNVKITVHPNTEVTFEETLNYTTDSERHGIFRFIPYRYTIGENTHLLRFSDIHITANGENHPFEQNREGRNLIWKIGDPDEQFSGDRTYELRYTVNRSLVTEGETAILRWDLVGDSWNFPVSHITAEIQSPEIPVLSVQCFAGTVGQAEPCQVQKISDHTYQVRYDGVIESGTDVTIEAHWTASHFQFPATATRFWWWLDEYAFLLFLPLPFLVMAIWWYRDGRDWMFTSGNAYLSDESKPKILRPWWLSRRTPMMFEPVAHLTPGEAGFLLDERIDNQDIVAEILELARKKYLKIERVEESKLLGLQKSVDYRFIRVKAADDTLPPAQKLLYEKILGEKKEKLLSELRGSFSGSLELAKKALRRSAMEKKLFTVDPESRLLTAYGIWIGLGVVTGAIVLVGQERVGATWSIFAFILIDLLSWIFVHQMIQKTATGTNAMLQARGLQQTIRRGAWREQIKEKHLFIEEILPFAVSLGVIKQLTRDMDDLSIKPPQYATGLMAGNYSFTHTMNDFQNQTGSGLSYNPSSSGSGSSGSSSSGGGFGGGGGGSW